MRLIFSPNLLTSLGMADATSMRSAGSEISRNNLVPLIRLEAEEPLAKRPEALVGWLFGLEGANGEPGEAEEDEPIEADKDGDEEIGLKKERNSAAKSP